MAKESKNLPSMYMSGDILEEIFLRLPLKSLLKFKTVSKQWRSIVESRSFTERRMKFQKKQGILVAGDHGTKPAPEVDEDEIEMVYFHCSDAATKPSLTCDGLVCIPVPGWVNVLNPSTGVLLRLPSGPDPVTDRPRPLLHDPWWNYFPGFRTMGFGKDIVSGSYKVVRMFFDPSPSCEILDVSIGEWRSLTPPCYRVDSRRKSVCVNGSIYWLELYSRLCLLALDLHTEEFRDLPPPPNTRYVNDQVVNLQDHLAIASLSNSMLEIWIIDAEEEKWTMTYCIDVMPASWKSWYRPVLVSEQGNVYLHDSWNRLLKYNPQTNSLCCICSGVCAVSHYVENLVSLRPSSDSISSRYQSGLRYLDQTPVSRIDLRIPNILFVTSLLSLIVARHFIGRS